MSAAPNLGYYATLATLISAYAATSVPAGTIAYTGDRGPVWSDANAWRLGVDGSNTAHGGGTGIFNLTAQNTQKLRAGLARVRSGQGNMKVAYIGDSTTMGLFALGASSPPVRPYCMANCVANILDKRYRGYSATPISHSASTFTDNNAGAAVSNIAAYDTRLAFTGTWVLSTDVVFGAGTYVSASSGATIAFTPGITFDTIDVYYITNPSYSSFTTNVNGGASLGTTTTTGTAVFAKATFTTTAVNGTVNVVAGSGVYNEIVGIAVRLSTVPAIEHYNMGASGVTAEGQAALVSSPFNTPASLPTVAPDLTIICVDINDIYPSGGAGTPLTTWAAAINTLITAGQSTGDVILRTGNPIGQAQGTNGVAALYYAKYYQIAQSNNVPLIDISARWQSYTIANATMPYGDDSVAGYLHPSATGYYDIAAAIAECFPL